jgi:hypothetical protein
MSGELQTGGSSHHTGVNHMGVYHMGVYHDGIKLHTHDHQGKETARS